MTLSDDEDESLAQFLETEVLSEVSDQEEEEDIEITEPNPKRMHMTKDKGTTEDKASSSSSSSSSSLISSNMLLRIEIGILSKIPPELFRHILKFLSSEDLIACSLVCRFLNHAASDESLWQRLYRMRWGLLPPTRRLRRCPWKKLYIERDGEDMVDLGRNCPVEFKEYYVQMQAAKRTQAPLPSQVNDDGLILDKTVADQVFIWKRSKGMTDKVVTDHTCSGEKCTYYQVGDVFVCEKTGQVHVCDEFCRQAVVDGVCRVSGYCSFDMMSPEEESDTEQQQEDPTDEPEPFMGSGRFGRAYSMGYNCVDEKELKELTATWKFL